MKKAALISLIILFLIGWMPKKVYATQAQLACSPTTSTVAVGQTITTDIILNTRSYQIQGADAILTYTTGVLDTSDIAVLPVTSNTNWTAPKNKLVDTTLGKVELDYGASQSAYTSSGSIGRITFTAKAAGNANVNFVFFNEYDNTTTGVSKAWGQKTPPTISNVLTDVVNCVYTVTGGGVGGPVITATSSGLPRTGNMETTMWFLGFGALILSGGLLLPRFLRNK